jgi:hypothetical protein
MKLTKARLKELIKEELSQTPEKKMSEQVEHPTLWLHDAAMTIKKVLRVEEVAMNEDHARTLMDALALVEGVKEELTQTRGR